MERTVSQQRLLNHLLESIGRFHLESEAASYRSGGNQSKDEQRLTAILHGKSDTAGCETHVEIGHCSPVDVLSLEGSCDTIFDIFGDPTKAPTDPAAVSWTAASAQGLASEQRMHASENGVSVLWARSPFTELQHWRDSTGHLSLEDAGSMNPANRALASSTQLNTDPLMSRALPVLKELQSYLPPDVSLGGIPPQHVTNCIMQQWELQRIQTHIQAQQASHNLPLQLQSHTGSQQAQQEAQGADLQLRDIAACTTGSYGEQHASGIAPMHFFKSLQSNMWLEGEECLVGVEGQYQPYCCQVISLPLNNAAHHVLLGLKALQVSDIGQGTCDKRLLCSINEVSKVVHQSKCLIVAPDVKPNPAARSNPVKKLVQVLCSAEKFKVPVVFALSRKGIGQIFGKEKSMSIVAILRADHLQAELSELLHMAQQGRAAFLLRRNETGLSTSC